MIVLGKRGILFGAVTNLVAEELVAHNLATDTERGIELREGCPLEDRLARIQAVLSARGLSGAGQSEMIDILPDWDAIAIGRCDKSLALPLGLRLDKVCINGLIPGADGVPERIWLGRRAADTGFAPLHLDAMVVGGRIAGDSLADTLAHEADEEAGLPREAVADLRACEKIEIRIASDNSLRFERYHVHDLVMDAAFVPVCRDGEVGEFLSVAIDDLEGLLDGGDCFKPGIEPVLRSGLRRWRPRRPA